MELTPVESSHIAAIGYLEFDRVLLVRYKDGALYAFERVAQEAHDALMASDSKGAFMHQWRDMGILISKGGNAGNPSQPERHGAQQSAPLNVIDEDAGPCCRKGFVESIAQWNVKEATYLCRWTCDDCGTQFYPEMIAGTRYWRIKSNVAPSAPSKPLSIADMRQQQKPSSAADCSFAVVK